MRDAIPRWRLPEGDAIDVLRAGYARTYRRGAERWSDATGDPSSHVWHQWRKRVKYHRHQVELLQAAWEPVMLQREDLLHDLTDLLGEDHDLAELRSALVEEHALSLDDDLRASYVGLLDARRTQLQHRALPLGARLYVEPPEQHCDRVFAWWRRAVDDAGATVEDVVDVPHHAPVVPPGT